MHSGAFYFVLFFLTLFQGWRPRVISTTTTTTTMATKVGPAANVAAGTTIPRGGIAAGVVLSAHRCPRACLANSLGTKANVEEELVDLGEGHRKTTSGSSQGKLGRRSPSSTPQQPSAKLAALGNQLRQLKAMGDVEGVETAIVSIENQMAEIRKKRDEAKPKSQLYYSREQRVKQTAKQVDAAKKAKEARQKDLEQAQKAFEEADKMLQMAEESHTTAKAELEKEEPPRASDAMEEEGDQPDLSQDQLCALLRAKIGESDEINQILGNLQATG